MTKRNKSLLTIAGILAVLVITGWLFTSNSKQNRPFTLNVLQTENGDWAYEIKYANNPFIFQENIPAVPGNKSFNDSISAAKVGQLMLTKIIQQKPPGISVDELKSLGIVQ